MAKGVSCTDWHVSKKVYASLLKEVRPEPGACRLAPIIPIRRSLSGGALTGPTLANRSSASARRFNDLPNRTYCGQ